MNGNDDCGQMSAWYIFSVMGFYPVTPGSNEFAIGAPQFPEIQLELTVNGKAKTLTIKADNLSERNKYIKDIYIDEKKSDSSFINYFDLINARTIRFVMSDKPAMP